MKRLSRAVSAAEARKAGRRAKAKGLALEIRVERIFKDLGKWNVRRDVKVTDRHGNHSQIDLVFGLFRKTFVECKNYKGSVPLADVAKFKEVLSLNKMSPSQGILRPCCP